MKKLLFFCMAFLSFTQASLAQCTNSKPTGSATQTFCAADAKTVGDIVLTSGSNIVWYTAATDGDPHDNSAKLATGIYYANDETGAGCSERLAVQVTVNGSKPNTNVSISECARDNPTIANLFAIGDVGSTIEWFNNETGGSPLTQTSPILNGERYWAQQTTDNGCVSLRTGTYVRLITTDAPIVNVSQQTQTFCKIDKKRISDLVVTLNDTRSTMLWYSAIDSTEPLSPTDFLVNGRDYWAAEVEIEASCESTNRAKVTVFINTTAKPTIVSSSDREFCEIDMPTVANLDITVTGTNLKWYNTLTSTTALNTTEALVSDESYYATQTDAVTGCESSERTRINVTINTTPAPIVPSFKTANEGTQTFCKVKESTIADLVVTTGTDVKWYDSLTSTTPLDPTNILIDGTDYYATQTDSTTGCESLERAKVSVTVSDTPAPTVPKPDANGDGEYVACKIDEATIADIVITGQDIKWYDSLTSTTPLDPAVILVDGTDYYATQTNSVTGCESIDRTKVSVTVSDTPSPTVPTNNGDTVQNFCKIDVPTLANIDITGTDVKWYDSLTSTTPLDPTALLVDGTEYFATQTDSITGCESTERTKVSVNINDIDSPTLPASKGNASGTQSFCKVDEPTVEDINIEGADVKWYDSLTSTTPLDPSELLLDGTVYYATQTDPTTGCESAVRTDVTVGVNNPDAPTIPSNRGNANINSTQTFCKIGTPTIADINITGENVKWYSSLNSTDVLNSTDLLIDGEDYFATQTINGCESIDRADVTVTIATTPAPIATNDNNTPVFCESSLPTLNDIEVEGINIKWYDSATSTSVLDNTLELEDGVSYFATQTSSGGCESEVRLTIAITLTKVATPVLAEDGNQFCALQGNFILSDLNERITVTTGNSIVWYDAYPNGTELSLNEMLVDDTTYYAVSKNADDCASLGALQVEVDLSACNDDDLAIYDGFSPNNDGINDVFTLKNIGQVYPKYTITFYNRWGNIVYEGNDSKPFWNGELNGSGELLPKGVYFYILDFKDNSKDPKQGNLYLSR